MRSSWLACLILGVLCLAGVWAGFVMGPSAFAGEATITLDLSEAGRRQVMDGFGTCIGNDLGKDPKFQDLYFDDLGSSIVRMDLTPRFIKPYSDMNYVSPWFYNSAHTLTFPPGTPATKANAGGPEHNNVRTYRGPEDYSRVYGGKKAPIAVMGPDIEQNIKKFNLSENGALAMAKAGLRRKQALGDFKLYGSIWSPAPWVKQANGDVWEGGSNIMPAKGTAFPFIWGGNFSGGSVDVSGKPLEVFNDGTGPTSALTQFVRSTAAYIKGLQDAHHVHFWGISIQNELNFPEFYNSCTYPKASQYLIAVKAVKREFAKYDDLKDIRILGPEDLLGGDAWQMWQLGRRDRTVCKNLQYLQAIGQDPEALAAIDLFCIHGYAADGGTAVGADPTQWHWWTTGWRQPPAGGLPATVKGFTAYGKRSWMTETSGEADRWLEPAQGFPGNGAFSIALKIQHALTAGQESAWIYWQFAEQAQTTTACLTGKREMGNAPKLVAARHFYKFIRPGAVRVEASVAGSKGLLASAYVQEGDHTLTVVLVNTAAEAQPATLVLPAGGASFTTFDTYVSDAHHLWQQSRITAKQSQIKLSVPGYGVATLYGKAQ